jgi:transcriptional regulator with XRE-family HTH domain
MQVVRTDVQLLRHPCETATLQRHNTTYRVIQLSSFLGRILPNPRTAVNGQVDRFRPRNYGQPCVEGLRRLIEEWFDAQNGTQADLARASGVPQNVISKWVNRQVDQASPDNLKKIAPTLGLTYENLLRRMGEIPESDATSDPIEQAIRARTAEMREAVRGTPRAMWATIISKTFDRAIDGARDMASLLAAVTDNTASSETTDVGERHPSSDGPARRKPKIQSGNLVPAV